MNQFKFKFGDKVRFKITGQVGVVTGEPSAEKNMVIQFDDGETGIVPPSFFDDVEIIPHPDTARLDFLISKGESAFKQNEVGDWAVFDPHSHSQLVDAKWSGFGGNPRAAIDAAMQQSD